MNLSSAYSVNQAKADLAGILHGTTTNQVTGIDAIFNRAARQLLLDLDPQETKRIAVTPVIYADVWDYSITENLPDLKGNKIVDVRPQVQRKPSDIFSQRYSQEFDKDKSYTTLPNFNIDFDTAEKSLRVDATNLQQGILLSQIDTISGDGTWSVGGTASNLVSQTQNVASGGSALQFNLAAGADHSIGWIENSTLTPIDLTNNLNLAYQFLYSYLPTGADFYNVTVRFGSSATNYWEVVATQNWQLESFINGFNLTGSAWPATMTGTPNVAAVSYVRVSYEYNGTPQTGVVSNGLWSRLGKIFEIVYYSKYLFRDDTSGEFLETVTADSNLINLDTETFNVFFAKVAQFTVQQVGAINGEYDTNFWANEYAAALARYKAMYKAEVQIPISTYYRTPRPGFQKYLGSGFQN